MPRPPAPTRADIDHYVLISRKLRGFSAHPNLPIMSYPGNEGLTQEMQERILSTFKQTLTAAAAGNRQEATLGCDFILRLDSLFAPARQLQERLEAGEGPVELADLAAATGISLDEAVPAPAEAAREAAPAAQPPAIDELDDLDLDMGLGDTPAAPPQPTADAAPAAGAEPPPAAPQAPVAPPEPAPGVAESPAREQPAAPGSGGLDELADLELAASDEAEPAVSSTAEAAEETPPSEAAPEEAAPVEVTAEDVIPEPPAAPEPAEEPPAGEAVSEEAAPVEVATEEVKPEPPAATEPAEEPPAPSTAPADEAGAISLDAEPSAQLDSESQRRIDDLLAEGRQAFDGGEYQGAIDAWSRIFLIDIDHAEANQRIEEARKLKAEADRKVEEKFHEGIAHLESGDTDAAADSFRAVLEMQSSHVTARDYLEKLEAGEVPVPSEMPVAADTETPIDADLEDVDLELRDELADEAKPKPDRGTKAVGESMVSVKRSPFKSPGFLIIAAAGLIAVAGGAWYLFNNWSSLFPNSAEQAPALTTPDPVARARGLHEQGKTPIAIAQLRRLPPGSPQYDEAQVLIAQWELEQAPADLGPDGPSPQEVARREALVAEAGAAADRREFMRTSELLSEAAAIAPLSGTEVQLLARADEQLQELQNFISIFREGEWDLALRDLWLLHDSDPGNRDVTRLLVDSYYNLGLRSLQRKDIKEAAEQFGEALKLNADDPELLRLADFAATYQTRSTDLLYRIYVKYVPFRSFS
jgi:tetratricopeptide (TPR) repeat protein